MVVNSIDPQRLVIFLITLLSMLYPVIAGIITSLLLFVLLSALLSKISYLHLLVTTFDLAPTWQSTDLLIDLSSYRQTMWPLIFTLFLFKNMLILFKLLFSVGIWIIKHCHNPIRYKWLLVSFHNKVLSMFPVTLYNNALYNAMSRLLYLLFLSEEVNIIIL